MRPGLRTARLQEQASSKRGVSMEWKTGMRVEYGGRRGTVLEVRADGALRVAWDDGTTSHRPTNEVHVVGARARR